eukprot:scaffold21901_cov23-Tisochrysis_lutea.AAC.1
MVISRSAPPSLPRVSAAARKRKNGRRSGRKANALHHHRIHDCLQQHFLQQHQKEGGLGMDRGCIISASMTWVASMP